MQVYFSISTCLHQEMMKDKSIENVVFNLYFQISANMKSFSSSCTIFYFLLVFDLSSFVWPNWKNYWKLYVQSRVGILCTSPFFKNVSRCSLHALPERAGRMRNWRKKKKKKTHIDLGSLYIRCLIYNYKRIHFVIRRPHA